MFNENEKCEIIEALKNRIAYMNNTLEMLKNPNVTTQEGDASYWKNCIVHTTAALAKVRN